jgi:hypothetical protein
MIPRHKCARIILFFLSSIFCFHKQNGTSSGTRFSSHLRYAPMVVIKFSMTCSGLLLHWMMLAIDISFSLRHKAGKGLSGDGD